MTAAAIREAEAALKGIIELLCPEEPKKAINAGDLAGGGKLAPVKMPKGSGVRPDEETEKSALFVPITKADDEQKTVTGVVLQPEVVDAQGDIIGKDVIREAAHKFLDRYNQQTKLGLQHNSFKQGRFALAESFIAPMSFVLNGKTVLEGSWVMAVKVLDANIWKAVKAGKVTGFSIGGKARVQSLVKPSL